MTYQFNYCTIVTIYTYIVYPLYIGTLVFLSKCRYCCFYEYIDLVKKILPIAIVKDTNFLRSKLFISCLEAYSVTFLPIINSFKKGGE
jgi:hypothetical protein